MGRATSTVSTSFLYMDVSTIIKTLEKLNRREIEEAGKEENVMVDFEFLRAVNSVHKFLEEKKISSFKIGKTNDPKRRQSEHAQEGYSVFGIIKNCNSIQEMNDLESKLIRHFRIMKGCGLIYQDIENGRDGGGGDVGKDINYCVYIIA